MIWYETWFKNHNDISWNHVKSDSYHSLHYRPHYKFDFAVTIRYNSEVEWPIGKFGEVMKYTKLKEGENESTKSAEGAVSAEQPTDYYHGSDRL